MKKNILFTGICIIFGVVLYLLTPYIHFASTLPARFLLFIVLTLSLLLIIIGFVKIAKLPKESKIDSIRWFVPAVTILVSTLPHIILSQQESYNKLTGYIIYRYDTSEFGVADKWGKIVVPRNDFESLFFGAGIESFISQYLIGVKNAGFTDNKIYEVRDIYVYKYNKGHFDPVKLYRVTCSKKEDGNVSLYSYIDKHIGHPWVGDKDYMLILKRNYVKEIVESELNEEIQTNNEETREETKKMSLEDGFEDLGEILVWYYDGERSPRDIEGFHLLVKSVNGDNIYYISKDNKKHIVYREKFIIRDWHFNAYAKDHYYFENPAWPRVEEDPEPAPSPSPSPVPTPTPQPRQLQPMSVWVSCPACHNSGQCQACYGQGWTYSSSDRYYDGKAPCYSCGGSGKCTTCAGQGGHNEIQYR